MLLLTLLTAGFVFVAPDSVDRVTVATLVFDEPPYTLPINWERRPDLTGPSLERLSADGKWAVVDCFGIRLSGRLRHCRSRSWEGADAAADRMAVAAVGRSVVRLPDQLVENRALLRSAAVVVTIRFDGSRIPPVPGPNCPPTICFMHYHGPPPPPPPPQP